MTPSPRRARPPRVRSTARALLPALLLAACTSLPPPPPLAAAPPPLGNEPGARDAGLALSAALDLAQPPPAPGAPPPAAPSVLDVATPAGGTVPVALLALPNAVFFDFASAAPRPDAAPALDALARAIAAAPPGTVLTIAGNTDAIGSPAVNRPLSEARARAVVDALVARGIPAARLDAVGFGATRPVASNATDAGRALNRRVELALSTSAGANRAALLAEAPIAREARAEPAAAPAPSSTPGAPQDPASDAAPDRPRHPAPLSVRPNRPSALAPNALGPPVTY